MEIFCSKILRYLAMLFMASIFIPGSSLMPNDQFLNIVGKLLDREHGKDFTENLAENLTKDDTTSIKDGLSKLLEILKDEDKDSVAQKNVNNARQIDAEELLEVEAGSKEGTDGLSKLLEMLKDGDKDSVVPKNVNNAKEMNFRSNMDEEQLLEEESESKEGTGKCVNTDTDFTDYEGNSCQWYNENYDQDDEDYCGDYDTDDFKADKMCCVCGGGHDTPNMDRDNYVDPENTVKAKPKVSNIDDTELKAFKLWTEQKEQRVKGSLFKSVSKSKSPKGYRKGISLFSSLPKVIAVEKCPEGYQVTRPGDVPGPGLISLNNGHNIPVGKNRTMERCAEICEHNSRCKSFLYSKKKGECKITAELKPSTKLKPQYREWVMCSKSDEDKICPQGYTMKIGTFGDASTLLKHQLDIGLEGTYLTADECIVKCDMHPECKSFVYSKKKQKCVMRTVSFPDNPKTKDDKFEDFRWCAKNPCKTTDGPVVNEDCVFPFIWRQKEYKTCTNVGKSNEGRFWCPTSMGEITVAQDSKTWGYCNDSCPQHEDHCYAIAGPGIGKDCIFPFTDRGKTYYECTTSHPAGSPLWCKTNKTEALSESSNSYGFCHSGCKKVIGCTWKKLGGEGTVAKNAGMPISEDRNKTLDECKDLCRLNSLCKSFSFKVEGGSCILNDMILNQNSKTKHVPGTITYYEPAACHDDTGNQAHAGNFKSASRSLHNGMQHYRSKSGSGRIGEGDAHSSESKYAANRMGEAYPTGDRKNADGMDVGHGSGSDVENFSRDIADTDNGVHAGIEAHGSSLEKVAHENENGFDSREKDEVRSIRDGRVSGSRTGTKGASKAMEDISKKQKKIWDKVLQNQNLLQKLVGLGNGNV